MFRIKGKTFKILIMQSGLTQKDTAKMLGVSVAYISMVANGHRTLSEEKTNQFLEAIEVSEKDAYFLHRSING